MLHHVRAFITLVIFSALASTVAEAQTVTALLAGEATDASGAALPGVTVTISSSALPPRSTVTDGVGRFGFDALPEGIYEVGFELAGFESARYAQVRVRAGESVVLDQRMRMAALTETVMVFGSAPPEPPPPPPFIPPTPSVISVPAEVLASVCGPGHVGSAAPVARVAAHRDERGRRLFGHGDQVILDAGLDAGLAVGTNVVVRRTFHAGQRDRFGRAVPVGEHGAGLLQIVEALAHSAVAAVVYACDEFSAGDYVERFAPQPMWHAKPYGTPDFSTSGRVLFGDEGQALGGPQQLMVIDIGGDHGLEAGQWITVFRRIGDLPGPVSQVGRAVVVAVKPTSSTIRIESARDAVVAGDLVAQHR